MRYSPRIRQVSIALCSLFCFSSLSPAIAASTVSTTLSTTRDATESSDSPLDRPAQYPAVAVGTIHSFPIIPALPGKSFQPTFFDLSSVAPETLLGAGDYVIPVELHDLPPQASNQSTPWLLVRPGVYARLVSDSRLANMGLLLLRIDSSQTSVLAASNQDVAIIPALLLGFLAAYEIYDIVTAIREVLLAEDNDLLQRLSASGLTRELAIGIIIQLCPRLRPRGRITGLLAGACRIVNGGNGGNTPDRTSSSSSNSTAHPNETAPQPSTPGRGRPEEGDNGSWNDIGGNGVSDETVSQTPEPLSGRPEAGDNGSWNNIGGNRDRPGNAGRENEPDPELEPIRPDSSDGESVPRTFTEVANEGGQQYRQTVDGETEFVLSTGHAYREHRSGPLSHPQRAGSVDEVESAIVDHIQQLIDSGQDLPQMTGLGSRPLVEQVTINDVTIEYQVGIVDGKVRVSDYWALP